MLTAEQFWQQSVTLYQAEGAQALLLDLQNNDKLNVNLGLLCQIADQNQWLVSDCLLAKMHEDVTAFSQSHTQKLRAIRLEVKTSLIDQFDTETLKKALLNAELEFEKLEQQLLVKFTEKFLTSDTQPPPNNFTRYRNYCQSMI